MTPEEQKKLDEQIRILQKKGIFKPDKRKLADDDDVTGTGVRYLIVGYGGTGAGALYKVKTTLEDYLDPDALKNNVRFLAVDTDKSTQNVSGDIDVKRFTDDEFILLSGSAAKGIVRTQRELMTSWMHPGLIDTLSRGVGNLLNDEGAGAIRQISRLCLMPADTIRKISEKVNAKVHELLNGNLRKLKVLILSGISGGTGSGVVIDLSYLIRSVVEAYDPDRVNISGFILLPPTGSSTAAVDVKKGNENGYAAMKEINYFMTLADRQETYVFDTAAGIISSGKDVFDQCYLIDGRRGAVHLGAAARETAFAAVSEFISDMVTVSPIKNDGGADSQQDFLVDSLLVDNYQGSRTMQRFRTHAQAPRDADYRYNIIGHSETLVPIKAIKAYISGKIYDLMYQSFCECGNVGSEDGRHFFEKVFDPSLTKRQQEAQVSRLVDAECRSKGPFYVVNLLRHAADYGQSLDYTVLGIFGQEKTNRARYVAELLNKENDDTYTVFTAVIEGLKKILAAESGILTDTIRRNTRGGQTFTFMPVDLSAKDKSAAAVNMYLSGLITIANKGGAVKDALIDTMLRKKTEWLSIIQSHTADGAAVPDDIAKAIIAFWNEQMDELVTANLEDFLIKYYTGNETASYDPKKPESVVNLQNAADQIYMRMFGGAGAANPMADIKDNFGGLTLSEHFIGKRSIIVPQKAPNLKKALEEKLSASGENDIKVFSGMNDDKVVCYSLYCNIPTYMLGWAIKAEPDYEDAVARNKEGLHLNQQIGGRMWQDFPNLLGKDCWGFVDRTYSCPREGALADKAVMLFSKARALGLAVKPNPQMIDYTISLLPPEKRPDDELFKILSLTRRTAPEWGARVSALEKAGAEMAAKLLAQLETGIEGGFGDISEAVTAIVQDETTLTKDLSLRYAESSYSSNAKNVDPVNWPEQYAALTLRRMPETMMALEGTIKIVEGMQKIIEDRAAAESLIVDFAKLLSTNLFEYNAKDKMWTFFNDGLQETLVEIHNEVEKISEFKLMYDLLSSKPEVLDELKRQYKELIDERNELDDRTEKRNQEKLQQEVAAAVLEIVKKRLDRPSAANPEAIGSQSFAKDLRTTGLGFTQKELQEFYRELRDKLDGIARGLIRP